MTTATTTTQTRQGDVVSFTIATGLEIFAWLMISLIFSVLLEWIGMTFWWKDEGAQHSLDLLRAEIANLSHGMQAVITGKSPAEIAADAVDWTYIRVWENTGAVAWFSSFGGALREYAFAMVNITQVFVVRLTILTLAMPVFVLFGVVGLADGLIERDIRRWGGGRESGYVFHIAARFVKPAVIWTWVIYLASPIKVNPAFVILPFAVLFGLALRVTAASFKKYL